MRCSVQQGVDASVYVVDRGLTIRNLPGRARFCVCIPFQCVGTLLHVCVHGVVCFICRGAKYLKRASVVSEGNFVVSIECDDPGVTSFL